MVCLVTSNVKEISLGLKVFPSETLQWCYVLHQDSYRTVIRYLLQQLVHFLLVCCIKYVDIHEHIYIVRAMLTSHF